MHAVGNAVGTALAGLASRTSELAALSARASDGEFEDDLPELDRGLRALYEGVDGCRRFLILYRPPVHAMYDPIEAARGQSAHLVAPSLASMLGRQFMGDAEQVRECLRLVVENGRLTSGGELSLEIHAESDPPCVIARSNQAAELPVSFRLPEAFDLSLAEFGECWNGATAGGRVETTCAGLVMNLRGSRRPPQSYPWAKDVLAPVTRLVRVLMPWRGAIGHYEYGSGANEETRALYQQTAANAGTLIREAMKQVRRGD